MSITDNFGSIHVPRSGVDGDDDDEDELERDAIQKDKELGHMLANAFDDLVGDDDEDDEWDSLDGDQNSHHHRQAVNNHHVAAEELRRQRAATLERLAAFQRDERENVPPRFDPVKPDPVVYLKPKHQVPSQQQAMQQQKAEFDSRNSRLAELEVLFESRGRELQRLQQDFENQARMHAKEIRSLKHQLALLQTEKSGVEVTLKGSQELLEDKQKEIAKMRSQVESVSVDRDRFEKLNRELNLELTTCRGRLASAEEELTDLKRTDTFKKAVQSYEAKLETMRETHRRELTENAEKLLAERQQAAKLSQEVERLKRTMTAKEREWEAELTEKTATVNRLTKLVKDAQNQCAEMVIESNAQHQQQDRSPEIVRCQALETDMKRLREKNRVLRIELDSTKRELESRSYDASFRGLLRKDDWEEEKRALESRCDSLKLDLNSEKESHRRQVSQLVASHRNQLATVKRKLSSLQARLKRLSDSKATTEFLMSSLERALPVEVPKGKLQEALRESEMKWQDQWQKSVQIRDDKWREELRKNVSMLKTKYSAEIDHLKRHLALAADKHRNEVTNLKKELDARNAEVTAAASELQKLEKDFLESLKRPIELPPLHGDTTSETTSATTLTGLEDTYRQQLEEREAELRETQKKLAEEKALFRATISEWLAQVEVLKTVKLREAQVVEARILRHKQRQRDLKEKLRWYKRLLKERERGKFEPQVVVDPPCERVDDLRKQLKLKVEEFLGNLDRYS